MQVQQQERKNIPSLVTSAHKRQTNLEPKPQIKGCARVIISIPLPCRCVALQHSTGRATPSSAFFHSNKYFVFKGHTRMLTRTQTTLRNAYADEWNRLWVRQCRASLCHPNQRHCSLCEQGGGQGEAVSPRVDYSAQT